MRVIEGKDCLLINGDCTLEETFNAVRSAVITDVPLIITDPPYGNVAKASWDRVKENDHDYATWMIDWTNLWSNILSDGGAFYIWGGIGTPGFRPFFKFLSRADDDLNELRMANLITWSKKRAYGINHNYLFTREELAYLTKGDPKKPRCFKIPLLTTKRGYSGYNPKYPAKSEFYRRTNVWNDITEIFKGKSHPTQKPPILSEIPIEIHTEEGEWVIDMFAGSGSTGAAARKLNRKFILVEKDETYFADLVRKFT